MLIMDYSKREFFPTKKGESAMLKALLSALIVVICGYLGCFLDLAGCIIMHLPPLALSILSLPIGGISKESSICFMGTHVGCPIFSLVRDLFSHERVTRSCNSQT